MPMMHPGNQTWAGVARGSVREARPDNQIRPTCRQPGPSGHPRIQTRSSRTPRARSG
jgi:hypothetical protein